MLFCTLHSAGRKARVRLDNLALSGVCRGKRPFPVRDSCSLVRAGAVFAVKFGRHADVFGENTGEVSRIFKADFAGNLGNAVRGARQTILRFSDSAAQNILLERVTGVLFKDVREVVGTDKKEFSQLLDGQILLIVGVDVGFDLCAQFILLADVLAGTKALAGRPAAG